MSVKDIEQAITQLPPSEVAELSQWFEEFQAPVWDKQIEQDAKSGRFATLIEGGQSRVCGWAVQAPVKHNTTLQGWKL